MSYDSLVKENLTTGLCKNEVHGQEQVETSVIAIPLVQFQEKGIKIDQTRVDNNLYSFMKFINIKMKVKDSTVVH